MSKESMSKESIKKDITGPYLEHRLKNLLVVVQPGPA